MSEPPTPTTANEDPVVSVLVLAYNHERYLSDALDSILHQDFDESFEVIIGEDCSTDGTLDVARAYEARYPNVVRVVTSSSNVGMYENHGRLLGASRGDFVAFCEGDDYWSSPSKLRLQVDYLRANEGQSGVHSDVDHVIDREGSRAILTDFWAHHRPDKGELTTFNDLLRENIVQTCSVMLRGPVARSFNNSPLGMTQYAVGDWPLFLHATMVGDLGYQRAALATYRKVDGSITNSGAIAAEHRISDQLRLLHDAAALRPGSSSSLRVGLRRTRWALAVNALRAGDAAMVRRSAKAEQVDEGRDIRVMVIAGAARLPGFVPIAGRIFRAVEAFWIQRAYAAEASRR